MTKSQGWYALGVLWLIFLNGIDETKASAGGAILASAALSLACFIRGFWTSNTP